VDDELPYKGIAIYQGTSAEPAGNLFTEWGQNEYHIYNEGDPVTYYYHNNPQVYPVEPEEYSINVTISEGSIPYNPLTSCPDNTGGGSSGSESMLAEYEQLSSDLSILEQTYNVLVDNGNTSSLESQVETTVPTTANDTKDELLAISPYVSDSVLKTTVANENAIDNIRNNIFNFLLAHYMNNNIDSAKLLLENEASLSAKYKLVMLYLEEGNTAQATSLLSGIPLQFNLSAEEIVEYADYISLFNILINNGQFSYQPDSLQLAELAGFFAQATGKPATFARNMLISSGMINYDEPILKPSPFKSSGFPYDRFEAISVNTTIEGFNIFPNPAQKSISIEYPVDETGDALVMSICSLTGTVVKEVFLGNASGLMVVEVTGIKPGVYVCRITGNGKTLKTNKLTIIY